MQTTTLAMTVGMALVYLLAVRLIDFNEKEPLWAVLTFFVLGAGAAVVLNASVSTVFLELSGAPGVLAKELARFVAIGGGIAVLVAVGSSRGYLEINGLLDGVVYGSAGGLGFATGVAFAREMIGRAPSLQMAPPSVLSWGQLALVGLSDGVYGALIGIGFAAALAAQSSSGRAAGPLAGYAAAALAHLSYEVIGHGNTIGDAGMMRRWLAMLLPVAVVAAVMFIALGRERRAIADELGSEAATGAVSGDELTLLKRGFLREMGYLKVLLKGDIGRWNGLQALHNRQVQLALAKQRAAGERDDRRRADVAQQVARLRASVFDLKRMLGIEMPLPAEAPPAAPDEADAKAEAKKDDKAEEGEA